MRELKEELEGYHTGDHDESHKRKAIHALKKMEGWNLFTEAPEVHTKYTVARDSFLAHLGSTLWGAMRHVIAPSVSDRPYHYYEKISFQLYFITQKVLQFITVVKNSIIIPLRLLILCVVGQKNENKNVPFCSHLIMKIRKKEPLLKPNETNLKLLC